jgi:iron complex transport system ATP-binding protein
MDEIIRVENLSGAYPHAPVFEGIPSPSMVQPVHGIGPNGSGKSTLLKFLYRELAPQSGQVLLEGKDIASYSRRAIAKRIALVPQWGRIEEDFTVRDAVAMAGSLHVEESLDTCDLSDKAMPSVLSLSAGNSTNVDAVPWRRIPGAACWTSREQSGHLLSGPTLRLVSRILPTMGGNWSFCAART